MANKLREDASKIFCDSIEKVKPEKAVKEALNSFDFMDGIKNVTIISVGKAAWRMAKAASDKLGDRVIQGIVITKYGHSFGPIPKMSIYEAGHPLSDSNSVKATEHAIHMAESLTAVDTVLMLISGGGSALFEYPVNGVSLNDIIDVSEQLIKSGANITEINTIRKRLSSVKAGKFAKICYPAKIISLVLSDVVGNRLDTIASGPVYKDETTSEEVQSIIDKYNLYFNSKILEALMVEPPKLEENVTSLIISSVENLCEEARINALNLGYDTEVLSNHLVEETDIMAEKIVYETRNWLKTHQDQKYKKCFILGGEMTVEVKGDGMGGRCQHFALKVASLMRPDDRFVVLAAGSDGASVIIGLSK
ncbi:glycerate kinase type-2 family protein [Fusibacter bizertensis]